MTEVGVPAMSAQERESVAQAEGLWWLFLVIGILWLLFAIIIFRFDWTTVSSISILFGIAMIGAALTEVIAVFHASGWWRLAYVALALIFGVIAIVAFIHPGDTFRALAGVLSFYFIVKGAFDLIVGIARRSELDLWWATLLLGVAEILLGFWAAGDFGHRTILLVVWVGAAALTRGISEIATAFAVRNAAKAAR
jgi:uncharacterized membrane protein HdeD (DUF308 family)